MKKKIVQLSKNKLIVYSILIILVVLVLIISIILGIKKNKQSEEQRLTKLIRSQVQTFYEKQYYPQIKKAEEDIALFLSNFETEGIRVSINTLIEQNILTEKKAKKEYINRDNEESCNFDQTMVILYPQDPYGSTDYIIKTILDCKLEEKNK